MRTTVAGLEHTEACRNIVARFRLPCADVDDFGIGWRNRQRADRGGWAILEQRCPRASGIIGLPHAAASRTEVEGIRLRWHALNNCRPSRAKRTQLPPMQVAIQARHA